MVIVLKRENNLVDFHKYYDQVYAKYILSEDRYKRKTNNFKLKLINNLIVRLPKLIYYNTFQQPR